MENGEFLEQREPMMLASIWPSRDKIGRSQWIMENE